MLFVAWMFGAPFMLNMNTAYLYLYVCFIEIITFVY